MNSFYYLLSVLEPVVEYECLLFFLSNLFKKKIYVCYFVDVPKVDHMFYFIDSWISAEQLPNADEIWTVFIFLRYFVAEEDLPVDLTDFVAFVCSAIQASIGPL